jgi:hypothetical protein
VLYEWDLDGDGVFGETGSSAGRGDEVGVAPTFSAAGLAGPTTWEVSLRVTDSYGGVSAPQAVTIEVTQADQPAVVGRHVFYNRSYFDGNDPAANAADDAAIATDKQALLAGGTASFANYTSYSRGINGIMVDIQAAADPSAVSAAQFDFYVGNTNDPSTWAAGPAPTSVTVRMGAGIDGLDRVTLIWTDRAIQKQWLQVIVKADAVTGLVTDDVFYFGNAPGESGNSAMNTFVDGSDFAGPRDNFRNFLDPAPIDFRYDYNRDSFVDGTDMAVARDNDTNFLTALKLIDLSGGSPLPAARAASADGCEPSVATGAEFVKMDATPLPASASSRTLGTDELRPIISPDNQPQNGFDNNKASARDPDSRRHPHRLLARNGSADGTDEDIAVWLETELPGDLPELDDALDAIAGEVRRGWLAAGANLE